MERKKADVALYLTKVDNPAAYGSVPTDADGNVLAFLENLKERRYCHRSNQCWNVYIQKKVNRHNRNWSCCLS